MKRALLTFIVALFIGLYGMGNVAYAQNAGSNPGIELQIKVYPNPTSRLVNLQFYTKNTAHRMAVEIKVKNLLGQSMLSSVNKSFLGAFNSYDLDLEKLPAGIYFLEVYTTVGDETLKQTKRITKNK